MKHFHGYTSIVLFFLTIVVSVITLFESTPVLAAIYLAITLISVAVISAVYCRKCGIREDCNHFIFGKISKLITKESEEKYNKFDYIVTTISIILIIGFPQYWLFQEMQSLAAFWLLMFVAGIQVNRFVCPACKNKNCVICPKYKEF